MICELTQHPAVSVPASYRAHPPAPPSSPASKKFTMSSTTPPGSLCKLSGLSISSCPPQTCTHTHTHSTSALNPSSVAQRWFSPLYAPCRRQKARCAAKGMYHVREADAVVLRVLCKPAARILEPRKKLILLASRRWLSTHSGWLTVSAVVAASITGA